MVVSTEQVQTFSCCYSLSNTAKQLFAWPLHCVSIISNLEMVYSVWEDVRRLQENAAPFCIRDVCEHPWIPASMVGPSTRPPHTPRDDWPTFCLSPHQWTDSWVASTLGC